MNSLDEKKKTAINLRSEIMDARVVANYGDPGLDEDYFFDILSRFVIVKIESCDRVLTKDKWFKMLAVVQRPQHLWIQTNNGVSDNPANQKREDSKGNINIGLSSNYSVRGISRINQPYQLGESIKIRLLPMAYTVDTNPTLFQSGFSQWDSSTMIYNGWHSDGATLPYINNDPEKTLSLRQKTIEPKQDNPNLFNFYLHKLQYEVFMLNNNLSNATLSEVLTKVFSNQWFEGTPVYSAHGGYIFSQDSFVTFSSCDFEDINVGNKMRLSSNECIPLVVTTPNSFPTPKQRAIGTIAYNPSYSPIAR